MKSNIYKEQRKVVYPSKYQCQNSSKHGLHNAVQQIKEWREGNYAEYG